MMTFNYTLLQLNELNHGEKVYSVDKNYAIKKKTWYITENPRGYKETDKILTSDNQEFRVIRTKLGDDGFKAMAVAPVINGEPDLSKIAMVVAGTDPLTFDFITALAPHTFTNFQYHSAKAFLSELAEEYGITNIVQLTGYSQGSLVLKIGAEYGIPTTTFNAWFRYWSLSSSESDYIKSHQDMFKDYRKLSDKTVILNDFNNPEWFGYEHGTIRWFEGDSHNVKSWRFLGETDGNKVDMEYYIKRGIFVPGMTEDQIRRVAVKKVANAKKYRENYEKEPGDTIPKAVLDLIDVDFYVSYYRKYFSDYSYGFNRDLSGKTGKSQIGDDSNNRFEGGADRDTFIGKGGNDQLEGRGKADNLYGDAGVDNLKGGEGDDLLDGGKDSDWLEGGRDNDVYIWREGDGKDLVTDEHGENRIILEGLSEKDIEGTIARGGYATLRIKKTDDMLSFIDFISNTKARHYILRYSNGREIHLADDADTPFRNLVGTADKDDFRAFLDGTTIHGKEGDDTLYSNRKNTILYGDEGNDKLKAEGDGRNKLYGGAGNDLLEAYGGDNLIDGGDGDDRLSSGSGHDGLRGGLGNDNLSGGRGNDVYDGGQGDDRMEDWGGDDTYLYGLDTGNDYVSDYSGKNTIKIAPELDLIDLYVRQTGMWDGELYNHKSTSVMTLGGLHHYPDNRWERFQLAFADGRIIDGAADNSPFRQVRGTSGNDKLTTIITTGTNHLLAGDGDDEVWSSDGDDTVDGGAGNDVIRTYGGNDTLMGGLGDDKLEGGAGDDTYLYGLDTGRDDVSDHQGKNTIKITPILDLTDLYVRQVGMWDGELRNQKSDSVMTISGLHHYPDKRWERFQLAFADGRIIDGAADNSPFRRVLGTAGDDQLTTVITTGTNYLAAQEGNDTVYTLDSDDTVDGGSGNDRIVTRGGDDTLIGGLGDDYLEGGAGHDTYLYGLDTGNDYVSDSVGKNTVKISADLDLIDLYVRKTNSWDGTLYNLKSSSQMVIGALHHYHDNRWERFQLELADGRIIDGAAANSPFRRILGTSGDDQLGAVITTGANYIAAYEGDDNIWTRDSDDTVDGGEGNDTIATNDGDDTLIGGLGDDKLRGGKGHDTYVLDERSGIDTIDDREGHNVIHFLAKRSAEDIYTRTYNGKGHFSLLMTNSDAEAKIVNYSDVWEYFSFQLADGTLLDKYSDQSPFRRIIGTDEGETLNGITTIGDTFYGLGGNDYIFGRSGNDKLYGGADNDRLYAYGGDDLLDGGLGDDYLDGGDGHNTYVYGSDMGRDVVENIRQGTILLTEDLGFQDVYVSEITYNITLQGASAVVLSNQEGMGQMLLRHLNTTSSQGEQGWQRVFFKQSDGTVIEATDIMSPLRRYKGNEKNNYYKAFLPVANHLEGLAGDDELVGNQGDDTLDGGLGQDRLEGGTGNDTYLFYQGDGHDRVSDTYGHNVLHFGENILPEHLKLSKVNSNLTINYHETDSVHLVNYFYGPAYQNFSLTFANKQTATIDGANLALNITPVPVEEEPVLSPEVTATQLAPVETSVLETPVTTEGQVTVQSVPAETKPAETSDDTTVTEPEISQPADQTTSSADALADYPTVNTGETMAYIAQPLPNVTNQVVG